MNCLTAFMNFGSFCNSFNCSQNRSSADVFLGIIITNHINQKKNLKILAKSRKVVKERSERKKHEKNYTGY
jgi:hypothetical protein